MVENERRDGWILQRANGEEASGLSRYRHEATSRSLRALAEAAAKEQDPENLRELILAIKSLLDVLERQVAKLEEPPNHLIAVSQI